MITLELGNLYGMDDEKELLQAIRDLQHMGWPDNEIQKLLERSKRGTNEVSKWK